MTLPFKQALLETYMPGRYVIVTAITIIGPDFQKDLSRETEQFGSRFKELAQARR
jgi:hypothetical protein